MEGIIYIGTNLKNGKQYIGKTTRELKERMKEHEKVNGCRCIHSAIKKYGIENFKWIPIKYFIDELNEMEMFWIKTLNTAAPKGYNLTNGGDGGDTFTNNLKKEKIREKSKKASQKYWGEHPEKKKEQSIKWKGKNNPMFGKKGELSPHWGKKRPQCGLKGEKNPFFGKHHSGASKKAMSEKRIGKTVPHTEEWNENISKALMGKHPTEETKNKIRSTIINNKISAGKNNPMYGRSLYSVWIEKYGKEIADEKYKKWINNKRRKII